MGILNVTPDSFSDGGKYFDVRTAVKHALQMVEDGADIIDVGGQSTRPNYIEVSEEEEIRRAIPVIEILAKKTNIPISIDTYRKSVAKVAFEAGAVMLNDIRGEIVLHFDAPSVVMHFGNDFEEYKKLISKFERDNIIVDCGIGFGKTYEENLQILKNLQKYRDLGRPMLLGTSKKSVIWNTVGNTFSKEGTLATTVLAVMAGVDIVRVHDVAENKAVIDMIDRIRN
jgi:dihydropteroate synthase